MEEAQGAAGEEAEGPGPGPAPAARRFHDDVGGGSATMSTPIERLVRAAALAGNEGGHHHHPMECDEEVVVVPPADSGVGHGAGSGAAPAGHREPRSAAQQEELQVCVWGGRGMGNGEWGLGDGEQGTAVAAQEARGRGRSGGLGVWGVWGGGASAGREELGSGGVAQAGSCGWQVATPCMHAVPCNSPLHCVARRRSTQAPHRDIPHPPPPPSAQSLEPMTAAPQKTQTPAHATQRFIVPHPMLYLAVDANGLESHPTHPLKNPKP